MENKVQIVCANTMLKSFYSVLDSVKQNMADLYTQNIIIVPDKFSVNTERLVFEYLNLESSFNIQVITLSRLIKKTCDIKLSKYNLITKEAGELIVSKILMENSDKLAKFNSFESYVNLATEFYETIVQLKSSGIRPDELVSRENNVNFKLKLDDLKFVYNEYEKYLSNNNLDSASELEFFANEIKNIDYIKNANIYVAMYDTFSFKQLEAIKNLAKYSKNFKIALSCNDKQPNKHIYVNETLANVMDSFRSFHIDFEIKNIYDTEFNGFNFLSQNLFGVNNKQVQELNNVMLCEADNVEQEIDFVARQIKYLVLNENIKFDDINIACANFDEYKPYIKKIFDDYTLSYYFDNSEKLSENFFGKYILNIFQTLIFNYDSEFVIDFIKSNINNFSVEEINSFENYVLKYGINYSVFKSEFNDVEIESLRQKFLTPLFNLEQKLNLSKVVNDYINVISEYLESIDVKSKLNGLLLSDIYDIDFKNILEQVYDKFLQSMELLKTYIGNLSCNLKCFYEFLLQALSSVKISTIPQGVNRIFIADINSNIFYPKRYLFVLGASEGSLPNYKNDCGLITDTEIKLLNSQNLLNPSIRLVNKCARYMLFENIMSCKQKVIISYSNIAFNCECRPSEVYYAIKNCVKDKNLTTYKIADELSMLSDDRLKLSYVFSSLNSIKNLSTELKNSEYEKILCLINKENQNLLNHKINDAEKLFFKNGTTSVSQIESYFSCPYMHYVEYGLRLQEKEIFGIRNLDVGNFLHKVAEDYVKSEIQNNYNLSKEKIDEIINRTVGSEIIKGSKTVDLVKIESLKKEAYNFCSSIKNQILHSSFKPNSDFIEKTFVDDELNENVKLTGKIDRVDFDNDLFILYDYKSGKNEFLFKDIFYGNKIQLIIYLEIISRLFKKQPMGAFYIPIKNVFIKDGESNKYNGVIYNNIDILEKFDNNIANIRKSDLINIRFKESGEIDSRCANKMLSEKQFSDMICYVKKLYKQALGEIRQGNINPSPCDNACKYCPYYLMCGFNYNNLGQREQKGRITKNTFENILKEEK